MVHSHLIKQMHEQEEIQVQVRMSTFQRNEGLNLKHQVYSKILLTSNNTENA